MGGLYVGSDKRYETWKLVGIRINIDDRGNEHRLVEMLVTGYVWRQYILREVKLLQRTASLEWAFSMFSSTRGIDTKGFTSKWIMVRASKTMNTAKAAFSNRSIIFPAVGTPLSSPRLGFGL